MPITCCSRIPLKRLASTSDAKSERESSCEMGVSSDLIAPVLSAAPTSDERTLFETDIM
jgi:hypothetical protein